MKVRQLAPGTRVLFAQFVDNHFHHAPQTSASSTASAYRRRIRLREACAVVAASPAAGHKVAHIAELVEQILLEAAELEAVPGAWPTVNRIEARKELLHSQCVSRFFNKTIRHSIKLRKVLFQIAPTRLDDPASRSFNPILIDDLRLETPGGPRTFGTDILNIADGCAGIEIDFRLPPRNSMRVVENKPNASWRRMHLYQVRYRVKKVLAFGRPTKLVALDNPTAGELYDLMFPPANGSDKVQGASAVGA
ncbi:hypothetical protein Slin14017_G068130 [Septoria linicola]|nr:hypothetical protein Slin14017_G068130 [Septoria linicola]